jgi:hypothetical protein
MGVFRVRARGLKWASGKDAHAHAPAHSASSSGSDNDAAVPGVPGVPGEGPFAGMMGGISMSMCSCDETGHGNSF